MTPQEMFDKAYLGVLGQGKPAVDYTGGCAYRLDKDGETLRCGVGHAMVGEIPEDCEFWDFNMTIEEALEAKELREFRNSQVVLSELQQAHDNAIKDRGEFIENFTHRMKDVANRFYLKIPTKS